MNGDEVPMAWEVISGRAALVDHGQVAPGGPMARHLGPRFSVEEVRRGADSEEFLDDPVGLDAIRAWPVPALAGLQLEAPSVVDLNRELVKQLSETLCPYAWDLGPDADRASVP